MNFLSRLVMGAALIGASLAATAQDRDPNADAIKYRQSVMTVILANVAPIAGMAKGRIDFDGEMMAMRAERIGMLSTMIEEAYRRDTRASDIETEALDGIWEDFDDFVAKAEKMGKASMALAEAARIGEDEAKDAFRSLGGSCKGCHDDYRVDKD